jgi:coproporphyrinogen III oxidase-like Fe-S oxidoreductase
LGITGRLTQSNSDIILNLPQSEPAKVAQHLDKVAELDAKLR